MSSSDASNDTSSTSDSPVPGYIRLLKNTTKDYQTVYSAVERGQASAAYTLMDAKNITLACGYIETFINETLSATGSADTDISVLTNRWDVLVMGLEKACKKGSFSLAEAAAIHQSAVRLTGAFKAAIAHFEKRAEEQKKVKFVVAPEDNIDSHAEFVNSAV